MRGATHENPLFSELQRRVGSEEHDDDANNGVLELRAEPSGRGGARGVAEAAAAPKAAAARSHEPAESAAAATATPLVDVTL